MTIPAPKPPNSHGTYADHVRAWAKHKPWEGRANLRHGIKFTAADVVTDGAGNISAMPKLLHKPCFGRPEVFLRQGAVANTFTPRGGVPIKSATHCDRCAATGVRAACESVSLERVKADPAVLQAFDEWTEQTASNPADPPCTGPIGRYWTALREAIADRGPFHSVNDAVLLEHESGLAEEKRAADRIRKRNQRATLQFENRKPPRDFIGAALAERQRRAAVLADLSNKPGVKRSIMKLLPRGREITADVWLGGVLLRQMGRRADAADIVRWMIKSDRAHGVSPTSLRTRIYGDLERVRELAGG